MKKYIIAIFFAMFLGVSIFLNNPSYISTNADENVNFDVSYTTTSSEFLQTDYLSNYAITTNTENDEYIQNYSNNGGNYPNNVLSNAFDLNFNTFWETNIVNSNTYKNYILIEFNKQVDVDRLIFATRRDDKLKGFPLTATFYISNDGNEYQKIGEASSELNTNILIYNLNKTYTFKYFKFEYTQVNNNLTQHCSASEIIFFKPEEDILSYARNLFADYKKSTIIPQYNSLSSINKLEEEINKLTYIPSKVQQNIQRAKDILNGNLTFDIRYREFSTNPNSKGKYIKQVGNISDYARYDLDMVWQGTNRQVTGIYAKPNETITIYVDAKSTDPLPQIVFTQHQGRWDKWKSGNYSLQIGENSISTPNLYNSSWSTKTLAGGPIYLINPYTNNEQSQDVKIYIEGGTLFPVFYMGQDEIKYEKNLRDYNELLDLQPENYLDLTEIVSNKVILTVQASRAYDFYISQNYSVEKVCENWDNYLKSLYIFEGVNFEKEDLNYDDRAEHLNVNIRIMQPYAAAYAYTEHVGIQTNNWQDTALTGENFGWGMTHELGHMMDISERVVSETTNNMVSNFNKSANEKTGSRENHSTITNLMAPDDVNPANVWQKNSGNAAIWWNIESIFPGYWGKLENMYRNSTANGMNKVEKQVYFSSIVTGIDLSYYFERYGYALGGTMFVESSASEAFKSAMQGLHDNGTIINKQLKFWYVDNMTYTYLLEYGDKLSIYNNSMKINIISIEKNENGYNILMPYKQDNIGHLGYEILEGNDTDGYKVIAFTNSNCYTDTKTYEDGYTPNYKIRAYDRRLNATDYSDVFTNQTNTICRINDSYYTSLKDAVNNASDNDTIYLLNDIKENNVIIDKNLTLKIDSNVTKDITLYKTTSYNIFAINQSKTFVIEGNDQNKIIFEGNNAKLGQRVIVSNGNLTTKNVIFRNFNSNISAGGVIYVAEGIANFENTEFFNNKATDNGGAITTSNNATININLCTFSNNSVNGNGGALELKCKADIKNSSFIANKASSAGAFINNQNTCTISNCNFIQNSASGFGGVCFAYGTIKFEDCTFEENTAQYAGVLYGQSYSQITFSKCVLTKNSATVQGATIYANQYSSITATNTDIYSNKSNSGDVLYLNSGSITLNVNDNKIEGEMYINGSNTLKLNGSLTNINATIYIDKGFDQTLLINNSQMSEDFKEHIKISPKLASKYALYLSENKKEIKSAKATYQIGITIAGKTTLIDQEFSYGDTYTLPTIDVSNKYQFISWEYANNNYNPGETITITQNANIVAVLNQLLFDLKIVIKDEVITTTTLFSDGETITLNSLVDTNKNNIIGWYYAGDIYDTDEKIIFDKYYTEITAIIDENAQNQNDPENQVTIYLIIFGSIALLIIITIICIILRKNKNKNKK